MTSGFVKMNDEQKALAKKILERVKVELTFDLDTAEVAFLVDPELKFTACLLRSTLDGKSGLTVGVSKRATYPDMADNYNGVVGNSIAFSRAVRNRVLHLIETSVEL